MKKLRNTMVKMLVIIFIAIHFASCRGNYTCDCSTGTEQNIIEMRNIHKKDAMHFCDEYEKMNQSGGGGKCVFSKKG